MKRFVLFFALCVYVIICGSNLFASSTEPTINFTQSFEIFHDVNVEKELYFQFLDPGNGYSQQTSEVILSLSGEQFFSSFVVKYNYDITLSDISMGFGYLMHNDETDEQGKVYCLPYVLNVYKANSREEIVGSVNASALKIDKPAPTQLVFADTVSIITESTPIQFQNLQAQETRRLVDLVITLDDSQAIPGSYSAYIVCILNGGY